MIVGETARVHVPGHFPGLGGEEDPRFSDYASCGARAGFGPLRLVPVTDREARRLLERLGDIGL